MTTIGLVNGINLATTAPLTQHVYNWVVNNWPVINEVLTIGGGWEVWAQVEIALAVRQYNERNHLPLDLLKREVAVFTKPKAAADFAIVAPIPGWPLHTVELKVESSSVAGAASFVTNFTSDVDKLIELRMKPLGGMIGTTGVAIGVCFSLEADTILKGMYPQNLPDSPMRFPVAGTHFIVWICARQMQ